MRTAPSHMALAFAVSALAVAIPAMADVSLTNGDFEQGPNIAASELTQSVPPGSPALTGWSVINGAVTIVTDGYWSPQSGHRSVALSSSGPGAITQSFASVGNAMYQISFWLSGEPFTTPTVKHLRVQAGATTQDYAFDNSQAWHWDMKWTPYQFTFLGTGTSTSLTFTSLDAAAAGPAIDHVVLAGPTVGIFPDSKPLALSPMTPDPVREAGHIAFSLPGTQRARLSVLDVQGREIDVLTDGMLGGGPHEVAFAPRGAGARTGLYFIVLRTDAGTRVRRFTVLR